MWKRSAIILPAILVVFFAFAYSCSEQKNKKIIVYSGQGLKRVMEVIVHDFEEKYGVEVEVIYAGSETLLSAITNTKTGDVFIPGSLNFINKTGELILNHKYVAWHVPSFAVRKDNPKNLYSMDDIAKPGVKIAIGNKNMCAIGNVSEIILQTSPQKDRFFQNISISGSTVNELLDLVLQREVDAALVWRDMLQWPEAKDLRNIDIPSDINTPKKIHVAVLTTTTDEENATLFADFVAKEGKAIFVKNGFGE